MKLNLAIIGIGAALAPGLALAEVTLPPPQATTATVNADGTLRTPANFFTANAAAISSAVSGTGVFQPLDSDLTAIAALATEAFGRSLLTIPDSNTLWGTVAAGGGLISFEEPATASGDATDEFLVWSPSGSGLENFAGWVSAANYRARLGLGDSATLYVGTAAGTVAAGDDSRIVNAVQPARTITAAGLATGGGDLSANRTITVTAASSAGTITGTATDRAVTPAGDRAALSAYVDSPLFMRAPRPWVAWFDGATTDRRLQWTLGAAGNVAGSPLSEVGHVFRVSSTAADMILFAYTPNPTQWPWAISADNLACFQSSTGALAITAYNSTGANRRSRAWANFRSIYGGKIVRLTVVFTPGTGAPKVYLSVAADGAATQWGRAVEVTSQFADANQGTPPDWMAAGLSATYRVCGYNWPAGDLYPGTPINRAITQADEQQMIESGALLAVDRYGGSMVQLVTNGDMSSATGWTLGAGWSVTGGQLVHTGTSNFGAATQAIVLEKGATYAYSFNLVSRSGAAVLFQQGSNTTILTPPTLGVSSGTFVATEAGTVGFKNSQNGAMEAVIDDFSLRKIGALLQPVATGTSQIGDVGQNRIRAQATAGVRVFSDGPLRTVEFPLSSTGGFVTGASTNPLVWDGARIVRAEVVVDTAGADLTLRRNSSSTNEIVATATDVPVASMLTPLTLYNLQRQLAAGETIWAGLSTGTGRLILELERN